MTGRWSPASVREDLRRHDEAVAWELLELTTPIEVAFTNQVDPREDRGGLDDVAAMPVRR